MGPEVAVKVIAEVEADVWQSNRSDGGALMVATRATVACNTHTHTHTMWAHSGANYYQKCRKLQQRQAAT